MLNASRSCLHLFINRHYYPKASGSKCKKIIKINEPANFSSALGPCIKVSGVGWKYVSYVTQILEFYRTMNQIK